MRTQRGCGSVSHTSTYLYTLALELVPLPTYGALGVPLLPMLTALPTEFTLRLEDTWPPPPPPRVLGEA